MYEVCKNAMPQIIGSLAGNQPNIYSNTNLGLLNPYGFGGFNKPEFLSNPSEYSRIVSNNISKYAS